LPADAGGRLGRVTRPLAWRWGPVTTLGTEIEDWNQRVPYEMRQAYASLPWDSNVAAKEIAQQFGHTAPRPSRRSTGTSSSHAAAQAQR